MLKDMASGTDVGAESDQEAAAQARRSRVSLRLAKAARLTGALLLFGGLLGARAGLFPTRWEELAWAAANLSMGYVLLRASEQLRVSVSIGEVIPPRLGAALGWLWAVFLIEAVFVAIRIVFLLVQAVGGAAPPN